MDIKIDCSNTLQQLPSSPGVYRFYDVADKLLYVGKALNLSKRVKSYFRRTDTLSPRISLMVSQIVRLEVTLTKDEVSALLLENNLIKSLKPKYNIVFRDDKTYPLIRISQDEFPYLSICRGIMGKSGKFFGPYPNAAVVKENVDTLGRLFQLRTCSNSFFASRSRPCILHQIKRCTAPCVGYVTPAQYALQVTSAMDFLLGKYSQVVKQLHREMNLAADNLKFEQAAEIRDKIAKIRGVLQQQIIINHNQPLSIDLITCKSRGTKIFI